jgi:hypothetical protein
MTNALDHVTFVLQESQAIAAVATTIGVLIALYVAVIREPRKAAQERRNHEERMDQIHRAHSERVAGQARKVVPSCVRTPMFGDSWWAVRIDNTSNAVAALLAVDVSAIDANGFEVPGGCAQANNTMRIDQAFDRSIVAAMSGFQRSPLANQATRDALFGHFATEWQRILPPYQHTVMAYTTTNPGYTLRITIDYEDEAGYRWRRTDAGPTIRMDN